jgi:cytochrome P450
MLKLVDSLAPIAREKPTDFLSFEYGEVKDLTYLQACIDEALRLHSTSALGLPRIVPEGGAVVCGEFFPEGTTLSVPVSQLSWVDDTRGYC